MGVLARGNATVGQLIHQLREIGVHASQEGGNPLTDSAAVQLILALLTLADHPGDTAARFFLAHSPLGPTLGIDSHEDGEQAVRVSTRVRQTLIRLGYGPAVFSWASALTGSCDVRETSRLRQLVELAYGFQGRATTRVDDFVQLVKTQRVADPSTADVRVMTLHQAKGLEFDLVVLPDLDTKLIGQPDAFVVHRDHPTGPVQRVCRYASAEVQRLLPDDLQQMFRDAAERDVNESLCVLYVALTRAVHALHMIIAPSSKSEKTLPRTSAGLLRAALSDGRPLAPEILVDEHGPSTWFRRPGTARPSPTPEPVARGADPAAPVIRLASPQGRGRRGLMSTSPSRLEGGSRVTLADRWRVGVSAGKRVGTLLHAWLELIQWLDDGPPEADQLRQTASRLDTADLDIDTRISDFAALLQQTNVSRLLSRAGYAEPADLPLPETVRVELASRPTRLEVHNERQIALRDGDSILTGNIDRLVLIFRGDKIVAADLIDFKTDKIDAAEPGGVEAKVDFYRPQLAAYRRAVSKMLRLSESRISARLLFVGLDLVRSV
jgi:ATP-dependent exoDNAse (exonuclease V) beta subunit